MFTKDTHSSPVRASYGVCFVDPASDWYSTWVPAIIYAIFYCTGLCFNGTLFIWVPIVKKRHLWHPMTIIWVRSRNYGCLVTWFCYQLIAKPGDKAAAVSWPDPYIFLTHHPLVTPFDDIDLSQRWLRLWLIAWKDFENDMDYQPIYLLYIEWDLYRLTSPPGQNKCLKQHNWRMDISGCSEMQKIFWRELSS